MIYSVHRRHTTVPMTQNDGGTIEVDVDLVPLITHLHQLGISIDTSCQGAPKFVDQTENEARRYRAHVLMIRSKQSLELVRWLMNGTDIFLDEKICWTIEFDRSPDDNINRISLCFPHQDIQRLVDLLQAREDREAFIKMVSGAFDNAESIAVQEMLKEQTDE